MSCVSTFAVQVLPVALVALSSTAPMFLTPYIAGAASAPRRRVRLPLAVGLSHAVAIVTTVLLARFAVFDIVQVCLGTDTWLECRLLLHTITAGVFSNHLTGV